MIITSNEISYYAAVHQEDPTHPYLLMLHGFMGSGRVFDHLLEPLKGFSNPVTVDLLGHGKSAGTADPGRYHYKKQVADLYRIAEELIPPGFYLHGYSMGGRLALRFAIAHPDLVEGLVLESTNYGIEDPEEKKSRASLDEKRARNIETDFLGFVDDWQSIPLFDTGTDIPESRRGIYPEIQENQQKRWMAASLRGFGNAEMPSAKSDLESLTMPVLLLAGGDDEKYRAISKEMDDLLPESTLRIVEKAAHRIHLENPDEFLNSLHSFLTNQK